MKPYRIILAALAIVLSVACADRANAQASVSIYCWNPTGSNATNNQFVPCSATNPLQVQGSISASLSPFTPAVSGSRGTPLSVTTSDSSGGLPTNTGSVNVTNVGANPMYCNVSGVAATTSDQYITASGGQFNFGIPSGITTLHCIATGGTTTANTIGGTGLASATGGGSSGGGGLSVVDQTAFTQGTSAFTPTGGVFNDTATLSSGQEGTVRLTTDRQMKVLDSAVLAAVQSPIPAGTNTIGTVGQLTYPVGATPITASATGTTAATTATLAGTTGKTTYVCGYSIRANATANTNVTNTLTGVISGTMSSIMWVPANTAGLGVDEQIFSPCIPASATNTGIAAVSGAPGTGGLVSSKIWGYQL